MVRVVRRSPSTKDQLAHVTQEMYKQNLELTERNKTLTLLRRIDEMVLGSTSDEVKITQAIASLLVEESDISLAAIYVSDKTKGHATLDGLAKNNIVNAPPPESFNENLHTLSLRKSTGSAVGFAAKTGKVQLVRSFAQVKPELDAAIDKELISALSTQAIFVCPLRSAGGMIGIMVLGVPSAKTEVSSFLKNLVDRLSTTVSIAVENRLLYEELQAASASLRVQNSKLRELDKTKDEFISMASHQLRTPLTTVKGYLSMILEGDMGAVKTEQKEMIQHAFDGANRMVYLIADLLNVSRLQTGKFVIDNKPTDLASVVETEIGQLKEQAETRQIELAYTKPEHFPTLNLDETKIRQVVMNFLDNALYYTPKGGKVEARLTATDDIVSYEVVDNGVGVPKELQHHLFTKFYRADNARKMRPDGTGLGLFMAKKVIVAQGGAVIFKSTEGKGSDFGFSFPRKAMEVKGGAAATPGPGVAAEASTTLATPAATTKAAAGSTKAEPAAAPAAKPETKKSPAKAPA